MADPSTSRPQNSHQSDAHLSSVPTMKSVPSFSNVRFSKIGQAPSLLKRLSATTTYVDINDEDDKAISQSSSPDLEHDLLLSSPDTTYNGKNSLQARISTSSKPYIKAQQSQPMDVDVPSHATVHSVPNNSVITSSRPALGPMAPPNSALHASTSVFSVSTSNATIIASPSNDLLQSAPKSVGKSTHPPPKVLPEVNASAAHQPTTSPSVVATTDHEPSPDLDSLKAIQSHLLSTINKFNPVDTQNALRLSQSIKERSSEVHSAALKAHEYAQAALTSAQKSMDAALHCLHVAKSVKAPTDDVIIAIEQLNSAYSSDGEGKPEWNVTLDAIKNELRKLSEWTTKREIEDAIRRAALEKKAPKVPSGDGVNPETSESFGNNASSPFQDIPRQGIDTPLDVHAEATRALNKQREEIETRKKALEEASRRHQEEEERVRQQEKEAQAATQARLAEFKRLREEEEKIKWERQDLERQERESQEELKKQKAREMRKKSTELNVGSNINDLPQPLQSRNPEDGSTLASIRMRARARPFELQQRFEQAKNATAASSKNLSLNIIQQVDDPRNIIPDIDIKIPAHSSQEDVKPIQSSVNLSTSRSQTRIINISNAPILVPPITGPQVHTSSLNAAPKQEDESDCGSTQGPPLLAPISQQTSPVATHFTLNTGRLPSIPNFDKARQTMSSQPTRETNLSEISSKPKSAVLLTKPEAKPHPVSNIFLHSQGRDFGNVSIVPRAQILPISNEVQLSNLMNLGHHNVLRSPQKQISNDAQSVTRGDQKPTRTTLVPSHAANVDTKLDLPLKPKDEPRDDDIPLLTPPPVPPRYNPDERHVERKDRFAYSPVNLSMITMELPMMSPREDASVVAPSSTRPAQNAPSNLHVLPRRPTTPVAQANSGNKAMNVPHENAPQGPFEDDGIKSPTMDSDWKRPNPEEDHGEQPRPMVEQRRYPSGDHYSPPPPARRYPGSRGRGRRVDHYSPPPRSSRFYITPGSPPYARMTSHSRGPSPEPPSDARHFVSRHDTVRSPPPDVNQAGRKRMRNDQENIGPPNRKARYQNQETTLSNNTTHRDTLSGNNKSSPDNWGHVGTHGPSPSPEPSHNRGPALQHRLQQSNTREAGRQSNGTGLSNRASLHTGARYHNQNRPASPISNDDPQLPPQLLTRMSAVDRVPDIQNYAQNRHPVHRPRAQGRPNPRSANEQHPSLLDRMD